MRPTLRPSLFDLTLPDTVIQEQGCRIHDSTAAWPVSPAFMLYRPILSPAFILYQHGFSLEFILYWTVYSRTFILAWPVHFGYSGKIETVQSYSVPEKCRFRTERNERKSDIFERIENKEYFSADL